MTKDNVNGIQIIGNRIYYKMELVATFNEMSMSRKLDEFKQELISLNGRGGHDNC